MEHAKVNGVELAYEVVGSGDPMLLIHGAHPFGGAIALELAAQHPTRVAALPLLEPPFLTTPASAAFASAMAPLVERYEAGDAEGAVHGFLALVGDRNWRVTIDRPYRGDRAGREGRRDLPSRENCLDPMWTFGSEQAAAITCPVLSVLGSNSSPLFVEGPRTGR